jgi:tetratricopeptide (TPR) repeat protein
MAAALVATLAWSVGVQRHVMEQTPVEVAPAGRAIAALARPGDRVLSRKGHVGFYAGLETVPFPRVATLGQLAAYAHRANATFLYYSWYECFIRPEFAYLLDSTAVVPGLTRVYATDQNPAVAFRIEPEFGHEPAWLADPMEREAHASRALLRVLPEPETWSHHVVLAAHAAQHDDWNQVLSEGLLATRAQPDSSLGWTIVGDAYRRLSRLEQARDAYGRAIALDASDTDARVGLGWVEYLSGHAQRAADLWRPVASQTRDTQALQAMASLFRRLGDAQSLQQVRQSRFARFGDNNGTN